MILEKELQKIRDNPTSLSNVEAALAVLDDNRIIYYLRCLGRPIRDRNSSQEFLAVEGSYNAGWHDCLDALLNFRELILNQTVKHVTLTPNYGARQILIDKHDLSEKERNSLGYPNSTSNARK